MIFAENLDHNPKSVTLEHLPDGTTWLYLRKDAYEIQSEIFESGLAVSSWNCKTAFCKLEQE